jgi:hypothetical protein
MTVSRSLRLEGCRLALRLFTAKGVLVCPISLPAIWK